MYPMNSLSNTYKFYIYTRKELLCLLRTLLDASIMILIDVSSKHSYTRPRHNVLSQYGDVKKRNNVQATFETLFIQTILKPNQTRTFKLNCNYAINVPSDWKNR